MQIAIIAPGAMGAGIAARLAANGAEVVTSLAGRSASSRARAEAAGMRAVADEVLADAAIILSIVPPGEALALARRLAPVLTASREKPAYVDCNAVSPQMAERIAEVIGGTGAPFVDAAIIGPPPEPGKSGPGKSGPGKSGPVFYLSGHEARRAAVLDAHGITVKRLDGPVGAASGLKMSYAGLTKGVTALGAAMILAATRFGANRTLYAELAESQPKLLAQLTRSVPGMFPKAYRWASEMEEIAAFTAEDPAVAAIYQGMARLYERLAADQAADKREIGALAAFVGLAAAPAAE
jgi:putative dehydrogenase